MTKLLVWLPVVFVVGGLVGMWGPREELRTIKERAAKKSDRKERQSFDSFARMINIPDVAKRRRPRRPDSAVQKIEPGSGNSETGKTAAAKSMPPPRNPEDLRERIGEAAELWRTRIELVRAATVKRLGLPQSAEADFDAALARMNDEIRSSMQEVAAALETEEELTPELGVRLMGDVSATMAEAYDNIAKCVDAQARSEVSKINLVEFIDPSVAEPFVEVQDKLQPGTIRGTRP